MVDVSDRQERGSWIVGCRENLREHPIALAQPDRDRTVEECDQVTATVVVEVSYQHWISIDRGRRIECCVTRTQQDEGLSIGIRGGGFYDVEIEFGIAVEVGAEHPRTWRRS